MPGNIFANRFRVSRAEKSCRDVGILTSELQRQLSDASPFPLVEFGGGLEGHPVFGRCGMPGWSDSVCEQTACKWRGIDNSNSLGSREGEQLKDARITEAMVIMDKSRIHVERREDALPQI